METETYKVAKEILEKFDPNRKLVEVTIRSKTICDRIKFLHNILLLLYCSNKHCTVSSKYFT